MRVINHIHMNIDTALKMAYGTKSERRKIAALFDTSREGLIIELQKMRSKGLTVISSQGCNKRSPTGECLGHLVPEKVDVVAVSGQRRVMVYPRPNLSGGQR